jgi:CYTH domain-containing protein
MTSGVEIERKFLVEAVQPDLDAYPSDRVEQGYLAITDDGVELRIRRHGERSFPAGDRPAADRSEAEPAISGR